MDERPKNELRAPGVVLMKKPLVCVQGLGFVGLAVATVIANAKNEEGETYYDVVGLDLPNRDEFYNKINKGILPFECEDQSFSKEIYQATIVEKNLQVTSDLSSLRICHFVICDVNFDIEKNNLTILDQSYKKAIKTLGENIAPECLILIESTVPPGYCKKIIEPLLVEEFKKRGITSAPLLCHSYERVMPGKDYLNSIRKFHRTLSADNPSALSRGKEFLETFVNTKEFPLKIENQTEATELAKILENSYRAMNIAFIYEWTLLAEKMGINLFSVVEGIRKRPTHKNIMAPGFGVGGYCLTKDALLAEWSAKNLYDHASGLPFSMEAIKINDKMPLHVLNKIRELKKLKDLKILLVGISYREDVGDTRFSPAEIFAKAAIAEGAQIYYHDPYVSYWNEVTEAQQAQELISSHSYDVIILSTRHKQYLEKSEQSWLEFIAAQTLVVDTFNILDDQKIIALLRSKIEVIGVGKGHINNLKKNL